MIVDYDIAIGFEESILDREHNDYDFEPNLPLPMVQRAPSNDGKIQISITAEPLFEAEKHWFTIHVENKRLEDVMNIIVGQMKNYKWEINDDVVNM